MAFNSSLFLLYFLPAFMIMYSVLPGKYRKWFLLIASILFYSWGAPAFLPVLAASVILDYIMLREMRHREGASRTLIYWCSIMLNLGLLLYFKYANFFLAQVNIGFHKLGFHEFKWVEILVPIGISFITFQKLACTFDVYKNKFEGFRSLPDYALYIFMFPQLLAGPIVRPGQIAGQISQHPEFNGIDHYLNGFYRFIIGLAKKVLIADFLSTTVNTIFSLDSTALSTGVAWMGAISYSFQIYFDFSGYSDMAIGLALMFGFKIPENFNSPYLSRSITEFWRRWHITLSQWFRDYIFLPLAYSTSRRLPKEHYGGLRADKIIYLIATSVTMLLCGFWHGAAWTFIAWGVFQGLFLIFDRLFLLRWLRKSGKVVSIIVTFFILTTGWVIFRSDSLDQAFIYLHKMYSYSNGINDVWFSSKYWTVLAFGVLFSFWSGYPKIEGLVNRIYHSPSDVTLICMIILSILLFIICEANINATGFNPFIYFRF